MTEHYCEFIIERIPRTPCDKIAHFKAEDSHPFPVWYCADHYDRNRDYLHGSAKPCPIPFSLLGVK